MVEIPDRLACLFTGSVTEEGDSYTVEVPKEELNVGAITAGETYQIVLLENPQPADIHSDLLCSTPPDLRRYKTYSSTEFPMAMIEDIVSEWIAPTATTSKRGYRRTRWAQRPGSHLSHGERSEVTIETLGEQGDGIAKLDRGYVLIVPDAQPDDEVTVEITEVRQNVAFAEVRDRADF